MSFRINYEKKMSPFKQSDMKQNDSDLVLDICRNECLDGYRFRDSSIKRSIT